MLKVPVRRIAELRRRENWQHVRLGKQVPYTTEQVEQILRCHTRADDPHRSELDEFTRRTGMTERSAAYHFKRSLRADRP